MPTLVDILKYQLVLDDSQFKATAAQADAQVNQLAGSIGGKLTGAVGLLTLALTTLKIGDFVKDATLAAARTEVLGTVLDVVGANAGKSKGQIALLEEEVKALGVTTQASRESIIKFIQSGLPLEKLTKLARTAQDSAIIAETNTAEALDRLVRGIQTQQIELLRSAGVFVSIEQELNKFAKTAGRTVETLTPLEKQTIILNAVLEQGAKLTGNYTSAMEDAGKKLTSLPRFFEETSNAIGVFFIPVLNEVVDLLADVNVGITGLLTNDALQKARDVIKSGGDFATRQQTINDLLAEQARIQNQIAQNEFLIGEASSARALIATTGLSKLIGLGLEGGTEKLKRDLEDIKRIIEAISEIDKPFDIGAIQRDLATKKREADSLASARKTEEREKRHAEKIAELAKTPTIGGDLAEGFDKQLDKVEKRLAAGMTLVANLDVSIDELDKQRVQQQINEIFQSNAPSQGAAFDILGIQDLIEQNNQAAQQMQADLEDAFYNVGAVAGAVFRGIGGQAGQVADSLFNAIANFSTGNLAGGFASVIDSIFSVFGGGSDKIVASQRDLINAIEDWKQTVIDLSDIDRAAQERAVQLAQAAIAGGERAGTPAALTEQVVRQILEGAGINAPADATLNQLKEILAALESTLADTSKSFESIIAAQTQAQRRGLVTGTTGADEALRIINTLTDIFDLNLQDQQQLLQDAFDDLIARGLLSDRDKTEFFSRLEDIGDRLSDATSTEPTQTERSIARVSERQADSLISGLATLDIHLREGFQAVVDALTGFAANALDHLGNATIGTQINIASVSLEGADAVAVETILTKNMDKANRAAGNTRLS